ncbi:pyocin knob domain-containing protein [Serratia marcescens]|uniref:pyocin knob domain-containing protein n=1 Tax=Serratia marcescens TaxID=615 RepID=UPI00069B7D54|nr:pyocin knob domain-containing protein [Serratia marcescens]
MQKIGDTTKTADSNGEFTDGDPQKQIPCTWIMSAWLNTLQREVIKVVQAGGLTLDPKDDTQLYQAIEKLIGTAVKGALPLYPNALTVDLNTIGATAQAGVYCQPQNADATTANHYPVNLAGTLLVTPSAYGCQQEYTTYSTRQKFVRGLTGAWNGKDGPWSDWASPPAYGWGMGPQHRDDAYNNVAMVYRVNGASVNAPGPNVYGVISLPCDGGPSTAYLAVQNSGRAFVGYSNLPANGVIWTEVYTVKNPPTADVVGAVKKIGDTMTGPLTTPYVASTPNVTPEGAGAYADQLNSKAPFYQPNWQWPVNAGGIFVPIAKGTSTRKDKGYPTAVSWGYFMPGNNEFAHPTIHVYGDNNFECIWDFNPQNGGISSKAGTFATQEWVNTAVHTNELKVGTAQMATDGNIWGTRWNPNGGWLWDAIVAQIQNVGQMSVNGTQWWAKINMNGGTLIVQGGYAEVRDAETTDRIGLNIAVPNRLLGVFITNKNFAQGYATYNPQVTVLDDNTGFNFVHGQKERMMYWIAVGY